jgi:hypothetical protein
MNGDEPKPQKARCHFGRIGKLPRQLALSLRPWKLDLPRFRGVRLMLSS